MTGLRPHVDRLVLVGRLDERPGRAPYPLDADTDFLGLPWYASLTQAGKVIGSLGASARRFWRLLDDVDSVLLLGPYVHAIGFALLALARRRRVVLGVRQDFPVYVRSRHPGRRWIHVAADVLEQTFRLLARRLPMVVVGPDLAARYRRSRRLLQIAVSLVPAADVVAADDAAARTADPPRRLLSVGRLDREKNPLLLVDVIAALHADDPSWRLTVVGDGPMRAELEQRIASRSLTDAVDVLGYVPIDDGLPELYRSSDAFLHVSWTEGVPQVLFEAFAAGLPVVATDVGGVAEAVGDAALLIPPGDAGAAVAAIRRLAEDASLRRRLVRAGVAQVASHTLEAETRRLAGFIARG